MSAPMPANLLNILEVASPCTASWEKMQGSDTVRFCSQCQLNVYNVSEMSAPAAERFLAEHAGQGRLCVRFYRRHDGTVITRNCPVGLAAVRAKVKRAVISSLTLAASLMASLFSGCSRSVDVNFMSPAKVIKKWLAPRREELGGMEPSDVAPARPPAPPAVLQGNVAPPAVPPELLQGGTCPPDKSHLIMGKFLPPKPMRDLDELREK